jgi:hypothetical protein
LVEDSKTLSDMEVLLDTNVVVPDCSRADCVDVVGVVQTVVGVVVTDTADEHGEKVQLVKLSYALQTAFLQKDEHHLQNVRAMDVIVVLNVFSVASVDPCEKER